MEVWNGMKNCLVLVVEYIFYPLLAGIPISCINYSFYGILGAPVHICFRAHQPERQGWGFLLV